jgi:putative acetyltransferase
VRNSGSITCRAEQPDDADGIRRVLTLAFPTAAEADLINDLRRNDRLSLSLVATINSEIVGQIAFSPVTIDGCEIGWGLAPLAVAPAHQHYSIGSQLIRHGLEAARDRAVAAVVVLGDPAYYARFGFQPASRWGWTDEYGGGEAFQAIILQPGVAPATDGLVRYAPEFSRFVADPPD